MRLNDNVLRNELGIDWDITIFVPDANGNISELTGFITEIEPVVEYTDSHISRAIKLRESSGKYEGMIHEYIIHSDIFDTELCPWV